jgi:hypothetical protein
LHKAFGYLTDMGSTTVATMVKAAAVAVLLMQCCDVILGARPLLHAAAGWQHAWAGRRDDDGDAGARQGVVGRPRQRQLRLDETRAPPLPAATIVVDLLLRC